MSFENRRLIYINSGILIITCLLYIVANVTPIWGTVTGGDDLEMVTATIGLWGTCSMTDARSTCTNVILVTSNNYAQLMSTRLFVIISCILSSFSILTILLILLVKEDSKKLLALLTKVFTIGSLIAGIIGVILGIILVMKGKILELELEFKIGASSILGIIAVVFNLIGAILSFIIK